MSPPSVRYTKGPAGLSIAYWTLGDGPPLVYVEAVNSHVAMEWDIPQKRQWYEALAARWTLVRFDPRNTGSSDHSSEQRLTTSDLIEDMLSVVDTLGIARATFFANGGWGANPLITFAGRHPDRVSALVLWASGLRGDLFSALLPVLDISPELYIETLLLWRGWEDKDSRVANAQLRRASATPDLRRSFLDESAERSANAEPFIELIAAPTLILDRRTRMQGITESLNDTPRTSGFGGTDHYAKRMSAVRRLTLPGWQDDPELGDTDAVVHALESFLSEVTSSDGTEPVGGGFQTILFTDLEASTPLTQRLGDEGAQELLRGHNESVRTALRDHGGREVKHTGDGIMASFPSAVAAVTAALQIQRELAGGEVRVRLGLNAGEPIAEDEDLFGLSVIKAARVADRAEPGQVLVSRVVRELCEGKTFQFSTLGQVSLKGFDEPVELFEATS